MLMIYLYEIKEDIDFDELENLLFSLNVLELKEVFDFRVLYMKDIFKRLGKNLFSSKRISKTENEEVKAYFKKLEEVNLLTSQIYGKGI